MTKVPATKKLQSSPNAGAVRPFYASENLRQVPDKPMKSIKYMDKEIINLKKDLIRSRFLIQSVKIGRGYFAILREETAKKKKQQQLQKLKEEEINKFQPAKKISEIQYGDTLLSTYDDKPKMLGARVTHRPFTPVHSCIISPSLPEAHVEPLFRQLCALHWLLEALTIDHTHHTMKPVITCWNPKDPGGSKSTIKKINKDKSMGQKWEHFVTAPKVTNHTPRDPLAPKSMGQKWENFVIAPKTKKFKIPTMRVTNRKPSRRGSTLSLSRASGGSSPQSSMISVNPGSDEPPSVNTQVTSSKDIEDNESSSTKPDDEPLSMNLQKLLEMVREDARRTITIEKGTQRKAPRYFDLLSKLPEDLKNFRPAKKILVKLQKFGENLDLRIRPHVLLKVLQDLRIWELCSPDIAVAIEFVREHIIHMPQEDYINWLQSRINIPIGPYSALR
ncbi:PREDICTED: coiled-coil domain-containing protein 60 isoform X10 [Rhinopithecus bieti]|uniref:coiled-coil domain-containing protein 60 isoform X10 n=1 Tax=Rhinopithecus bieti TaxID=61621 RepID=UPI00083BD9D4|nr:PREDICTED: coiled-coil domain-containing protein 60 isoform X10 [Rhinopithecus bieti]